MADGADLSFDTAKLDVDVDAMVRAYLAAGTTTIANVTKRLERSLEAATQSAVPGRLWRAWASRTDPKSGPARDPVGRVFVNGGTRSKGALTFWSQPGAVRGKSDQYLAIPLPASGARGRGRDLTPGDWERRTGQKLIFLYRQGKPSLLVAKGTTGRGGGFRALTPGKSGRIAKGRAGANPLHDAVIPIFVLLLVVPFRNTVAIQPLVAAAEAEIAPQYLSLANSIR